MSLTEEIKIIKKKILDEISFITIKKGTELPINEGYYKLENELPVPLLIEDLLSDLKNQSQYDGIDMKKIIKAMMFMIGADEEFEHNPQYTEIIKKSLNNPKMYIQYLINFFSNDEYKCFVLACSMKNFYSNEIDAAYIYGNALEMIGEKYHRLNQNETANLFFEESAACYNDILDIDTDFDLSYYKLGYYYKTRGQLKKARVYWEKYIMLSKEIEMIDEIREQITLINPSIELEECYELIELGKYDHAIDRLLKLNNENPNWWNALFTLGLAFRQKGEFGIAARYYENVLKINNASTDAINELALCYLHMGKYIEAEKLLDTALIIDKKSEELFSNRAVARYYLDNISGAKEDIEKALELNPEDVVALNIKKLIEKIQSQ